MKKIHLFFLVLIAIVFHSCEDVVPVDLRSAPPKLVIDASIHWQKNTPGNEQKIKLTTTSDYFSPTIPVVSGATVFVKNSKDAIFNFIETPNTGEYVCTNFIPEINEVYKLTVITNGQTYTAEETLKRVAPITKIVQNNEGGFTGKNIEIKTFYTDYENEDNYYLYKYDYSNRVKKDYSVSEDTFFKGNEFFSISQNDKIKQGETVNITHYGISKAYYNYMSIVINIAGNTGGSPFQTPPATVRGNIVNTTDFANYPLGYFSLSEVDVRKYVVE